MGAGCGRYVKTGLVEKGLRVAGRRWPFECMKFFSEGVVLHVCEQRCRVALSKDR